MKLIDLRATTANLSSGSFHTNQPQSHSEPSGFFLAHILPFLYAPPPPFTFSNIPTQDDHLTHPRMRASVPPVRLAGFRAASFGRAPVLQRLLRRPFGSVYRRRNDDNFDRVVTRHRFGITNDCRWNGLINVSVFKATLGFATSVAFVLNLWTVTALVRMDSVNDKWTESHF